MGIAELDIMPQGISTSSSKSTTCAQIEEHFGTAHVRLVWKESYIHQRGCCHAIVVRGLVTFWRSVWAIPAVCMENIQLQIYSETITALHVSFALSNALVVPLWNFGAQLFVFSISITFIHSFLLISSVWIECQARLLLCSRASFPSLGCGVFCCFRCLFVVVFFLLELRAEWYVRASATLIAKRHKCLEVSVSLFFFADLMIWLMILLILYNFLKDFLQVIGKEKNCRLLNNYIVSVQEN